VEVGAMVRKIPFVLLILAGVALWQAAARCFAETRDVAGLFEEAKKY